MGEFGRVHQLPCALPGRLDLVDDKAPEGSTGALRSLRARATAFACPDVVVGAVPMDPTTIVEGLACGTDLAIVFGFECSGLTRETEL